MRKSLQKSQQDLLHAERLATIGRMASTISHDLRHPLTTILAYAEFQSEGDLDASQRKALYDEIRSSVNRMAELISSLLEFSKGQEALQLTHGDVVEALERTLSSVRIRPEFKGIQITVAHEGATTGLPCLREPPTVAIKASKHSLHVDLDNLVTLAMCSTSFALFIQIPLIVLESKQNWY